MRTSWSRNSIVFFGLACIFVLAFRVIYSTPMEFDGDSVGKWFSAVDIARNQNWMLMQESHHELRWSIIIPQVIVEKFLPGRYENYFVLPIIFYSLFTIFCSVSIYNSKKERLFWCALAVLVILCDPISHVMGSQLKTPAFGLFYLSIGILFLNGYMRKKTIYGIVLSALFFIFAYAAHITYLVFSVIPIIVLVAHQRDYKGAAVFLILIVGLIAVESLVFLVLSGGVMQGGRLQNVLSGATHTPVITPYASSTLLEISDLFSRWKLVPKYNFLILMSFLIGSLVLLKTSVRRAMPNNMWPYFYSAIVYGLAITFPIVGFSPLKLAMGLHTRYLAPFFPLAVVFLVWLLSYVIGNNYRHLSKVFPIGVGITLLGFFWYGSVTYRCFTEVTDLVPADSIGSKFELAYCHSFRYSQNQNIYPNPNMFLFRAQRYYEQFNRDYLEGKVGLFGATRIGIFRFIVTYQHPNALFNRTETNWYTVDGKSPEKCVMELGQTPTPEENYRNCAGQSMSRSIFD